MFVATIIVLLFTKAALSDKSLIVVLDISGSMEIEKTTLTNYLPEVLRDINNPDIVDYILVPFSNPDVGTRMLSSNWEGLISSIKNIEYTRNPECREVTIEGIKKALQVSRANSYIYVFTDAEPIDAHKLDSVQKLCRSSGSQVFIFRSGTCNETLPPIREQVYNEVAKSCNGAVFNLDVRNFYQAFRLIKEISSIDWTLTNTSVEFTDSQRLYFTVKEYTKNLIVAVSCESPLVEIRNDEGDQARVDRIMSAAGATVLNVYPDLGNYTVDIQCNGVATATIFRRLTTDFEFGFSPTRANNIHETSARPLPDSNSNIYVALPANSTGKVVSIILQWDNHESKELEVESTTVGGRRTYYSNHLFESGNTYRIVITCKYMSNDLLVVAKSGYFKPQETAFIDKTVKPYAEPAAPEPPLIEFESSFQLSCKVIGNPKPEISWKNNMGDTIKSKDFLLENPNVYISYATLYNVTTNSSLDCRSKNSVGEHTITIDYYVHRPFIFDVIQYPEDTSVVYDEEGKLYCEVNAYPKAEIKWFHNDTLVTYSDNLEVVSDENALIIKRMSLDDAGQYRCVISNEVESKEHEAVVSITGISTPKIEINETEIILNPGDSMNIDCKVTQGTPTPEVIWKHETDQDIPDGLTVDGSMLSITSATTQQSGTYICEAINIIGSDAIKVVINVQYKPLIREDVNEINVREQSEVVLPCEVDAEPPATVRWDMHRDNTIIAMDDHYSTYENNTLRFKASFEDRGSYLCIAENVMGKTVRTVRVNVYVEPIFKPVQSPRTVRFGSTVTIPCNLLQGYPLPTTIMEFIDLNSNIKVLKRANGSLEHIIYNVNYRNIGTYKCIAESNKRHDLLEVKLKVV